MQFITRLILSSLMITTLAPVYAGDCKEKEHSPKSADKVKKIVTENDVYAQKLVAKTYAHTIAGACKQASDELAVCNTATLTVAIANSMKIQQLAKIPLMSAFMQAQKLYADKNTPYAYSTAKMPELFALIAPTLLAHNNKRMEQRGWAWDISLTTQNNPAYVLIEQDNCVGITVETMTRRDKKITCKYSHTHIPQKKDQ